MKKLRLGFVEQYSKDLTSVAAAVRAPSLKRIFNGAQALGVAQAASYTRTDPANRLLASQLDAKQKAAFLHCWQTRSKPVSAIRDRVFSNLPLHHQGRCPYCALAAEPATLDHFCEKASLPELCLYDRNLIPCCYMCNNCRLTTFGADGQQVIHFYDDDVDNIPDVLVASIDESGGTIVADFGILQPVPTRAMLYVRHFHALKLRVRYRRWAATAMRDSLTDVDLPESDPVTWQSVLLRMADRWHARWGNNEPRVALARALACRTDLIKRLISS
jgi:hypothetical protein